VLAAVSLLAQEDSPHQPVAMVLMGGPVDTEAATSEVTELAEGNEIEFFENNLIGVVPPGFPGAGRKVFPGFVALGSFLAMNPGRHVKSYMQIWNDRIQGRHAAADKKVRFYDEYNAVLDNYGRFYLETVQEVLRWRERETISPLPVRPLLPTSSAAVSSRSRSSTTWKKRRVTTEFSVEENGEIRWLPV